MKKLRIVPVLLTLAFIALAGCKTTGELPPDWFYECNCNSGP